MATSPVLSGPRFPNASLDGDGDRVDYFRFTLTEAKEVGLGLRQQDADADLFLEDAEGNVLHSSTVDGTANEAINETLLAGTYYVRVEVAGGGRQRLQAALRGERARCGRGDRVWSSRDREARTRRLRSRRRATRSTWRRTRTAARPGLRWGRYRRPTAEAAMR